MTGDVQGLALFWPGGQKAPASVDLIGVGMIDPTNGKRQLIMAAGRYRYVVDEADIMRLPAAAGLASLSPQMGNA